MGETAEQEITGTFGPFSTKLSGQGVIYIAILAMALGAISYMLWVDVRENRTISHSEHQTLQDGIEELVYVQSLDDQERKKLNLRMPDSLRTKVRER